jgi:hypothetical protein
MLHIVSELMFVGLLAGEAELPTPAAGVLEQLPLMVCDAVLDAAPAAAQARPRVPFGQPASTRHLAEARGGADIASDTRLGGEVAGNTASQVTTGANRIDTGSFAGSVGLPVVIQNSGANVLIQNATVINLQFK